MRRFALVAAVVISLLVSPAPAVQALDGVTEVCRFSDPRFDEISGMTYSQRHAGVVYLHNDSSGGPRVYAVDARTCRTLATLTLEGAQARDFEAIGSGRDAKGRPVLWIGDIGDNRGTWPEVRVLRVREPRVLRDRSVKVRTYRFAYPDGPQDAEALLTDPGSTRVWVVTKKLARGTLYALDRPSRTGVAMARRIGPATGLATDGAVSPDGTRYVVRDYADAEVFQGLPPGRRQGLVYLPLQMQGEALTWTPDGTALLVAGEGDRRLLRVALTLR